MSRTSFAPSFSLDVSNDEFLSPQDLLPHSSADQEKIAPWTKVEESSQLEEGPPTPPAKSSVFGFQHKLSTSTLGGNSTISLLRSRPSDTFSVDSGSTYGDALRPHDVTRKSSSNPISRFGNLIKKRSKSALRAGLQIDSTAVPDVPPLPSPDYIPFRPMPPSPPPPSEPSRKGRKERKKKATNAPPPLPPKEPQSEFSLDTNLDEMDGIIDLNILPQSSTGADLSSPSSGFESSAASTHLTSDVSSLHHDHPNALSPYSGTLFSNPFQPSSSTLPTRGSASGGHVFDGRRIPPKSLPPPFQSPNSTEKAYEDGDKRSWTAPESWAVEKDGEEVADVYSSSDESINKGMNLAHNRRKRARQSMRTRPKDGDVMYKIRIYRANNSYHVVSIDLGVTVAELTPQLNKKLLLRQDAEVHRLYLKERGRERVLAQTEKPANIVRRRLEQAGYDVADGLDILGAEDIQFLMKFVYKSNVLGPAEEDLNLDNFEYIDLTSRSLKTIPVVLYSHAEEIVSLKLSRNPMLEIPLDFIQACTTLRELRLSNMAMKKVPQSVRHCVSLNRLDLSCNRIGDLEDSGLVCLSNLTNVKLQNNRLERLPRYFHRLDKLKTLNISNNKFHVLPEVVGKLTGLLDLDISFNMISEFPQNIGDLHALERLIIVGNRVVGFPESCSKLISLKTLDCRRNNISDLSVVCMLPKVESIMVDHNAVPTLDLSFGPSLKQLYASNNDITQLTLASGPIGMPYALTHLDISCAKLSSLDGLALSHLTSLRSLRFCQNSIRTIPDSIGELSELQRLACSNNRIYALPASIGNLQKLETLQIHNNSLKELPVSIWQCASLTTINMTSNLLGSFKEPPLPPNTSSSFHDHVPLSRQVSERKTSTGSLLSREPPPLAKSLEKLLLGENQLTEDALRPMMLLKNLKVLNLSFNDISEIPPGFFTTQASLEELYLSGNKLSSLPTEDLSSLQSLKVLFLNGNRLQTLPRELASMLCLTILDVGSNNLKYNINNTDFDWHWNYNPSLQYLNLSGNKRLEIKPDSKVQANRQIGRKIASADFGGLHSLKVLGLIDVTTSHYFSIPDDNEDRRVRTSLSEVNGMAYGIADTLGAGFANPNTLMLNTFDLVQPHFRDRKDEAVFAMFGRSVPSNSNNRVSRYLHDHFLPVFAQELDIIGAKGGDVTDALRRCFLKLNKYLHDFLFNRDPRRPSIASSTTSTPYIDVAALKSGASGVVVYLVDRTLYVANTGNSLAVLSHQGTAELLSRKHDPLERSETARIRSAEGWVSPKGLVNDELDVDVSRSFGFYYLLPIVNARPDIVVWPLTELDEFLIIANQGLWDLVPYQTAVDIARCERSDPMIAAQKLRDFAISYGAEQATMIMVISVADLFMESSTRSRQPTLDPHDLETYVTRRRPRRDEIINKDLSRLVDEVSPPVGHIALVFTDIRNSTHLWEVNAGMETAIQQHNQLLRRQLRLCGGYEVKTEGDAFICSFPTAMSAMWWCLSVQVELLKVAWPLEILECEDGQEIHDANGKLVARGLSVRMGVHQGRPLCEPDPITGRMDYFGPVVNRASRISGSAQGGQTMCSADIIREINAALFETAPRTEQSSLQPSQAIEAVRRLGIEISLVGEVKLKGLEVPEMLSLVYPKDLVGRHNLEAVRSHPGAAGSRVQFSVDQMQELALLCIRLETLTSSRVFRPITALPSQTDSPPKAEESNPNFLYGNLNVLLPSLDKASDAELMQVLDSLSLRIENALAALTLKQIVAMNKTVSRDNSSRRHGGSMDVRTLQQLLSFLAPS